MAVAHLLAWPVVYYSMHAWLADFAYPVDLSPESFLLCGALSLALAMVPLWWQAFRASASDPTLVLRCE